MVEYYKLYLLMETDSGLIWEKIYLGMKNNSTNILEYIINEMDPLDGRIEPVCGGEAIGFVEEN